MGKLTGIIIALIFGGAALAIFFGALPRIDRYLNILSVQACSNSAHLTSTQGAITAQYPIQDIYDKCISQTK